MGIVTDIMNLVKDLKQSLADGKVDKNEAAKIAADVADRKEKLLRWLMGNVLLQKDAMNR